MVGREPELEAGRRFLDAVDGGLACLVLEGEPGIGKTTVWREVVALAAARSHRILTSRCAAAEAKLSYAGLADLFSDLEQEVVEALPLPQKQALQVALLQAAPGQRPPQPRALFTAVQSVLSALARLAPVVIAIDDLQWLDPSSLAALQFALRRLGQCRVGFLTSLRRAGDSGSDPSLDRTLGDLQALRLTLGPLSLAALHTVISTHLGRPFPRPILVKVAGASRGNPLHALEIARELSRQGGLSAGEALPVPENVLELVSIRIRRLPAATREALLVASALRKPVVELVDRAAMEPAERAGLVQVEGRNVNFVHPLFASAVYGSARPERRRRLHHRLAARVTDPEERARHLALAAEGPSEKIASALEEAAIQARLKGAPEGAAELLELAASLTFPDQETRRCLRTIAAAEHYFHAGDLGRARVLAEGALAGLPAGPSRGNALRVLGEIRYHLDSFNEAIRLFEQALPELDQDRRQIEVRVNLTFAHIGHGSLRAAAEHAAAAVEQARGIDDRGLHAIAVGGLAIADFFLGRPLERDRIELALAHEDPDRQTSMSIRPSMVAGIALSLSDDLSRAAALLRALRQRTIDRGEESDLPLLCAQLGYVERRQGNLRESLDFAQEGYRIACTLGSETSQALMLAERCFARAALGDAHGARADVDAADAILARVGYRLAYFWRRWALTFLEISLGNAVAARVPLQQLVETVERRGYFSAQVALSLPDTIEALAMTGQEKRANALAGLLEEYGLGHALPSVLGTAGRCRALALAAGGDLSGALASIEKALTHHERAGAPLELGRTLLLKGQIERRLRLKRVARTSLQRSLDIFQRTGARLWVDRVQAELSRAGWHHSGPEELTATELRVAELAAGGLTMKQIAELAFLSPKTVEANLARIYSKLGIRSRAELGRAMAKREAGTPK